jgi:hypothetical protein
MALFNIGALRFFAINSQCLFEKAKKLVHTLERWLFFGVAPAEIKTRTRSTKLSAMGGGARPLSLHPGEAPARHKTLVNSYTKFQSQGPIYACSRVPGREGWPPALL